MANVQQLVTEHIDVWTSAIEKKSATGRGSKKKIRLQGVKKLRELILDLAVRGKLVQQDPNDEPASIMIEKIATEKVKQLKEGKIKKQKPLPEISHEEKVFDLPLGWEFVKLGQLMEMFNGRAFKSTEWSEEGLPIIRIQNLNDPSATFNYFSGEVAEQHLIKDGTFLISWSGTPGTSFGAFIWNRGTAALNQHINKCYVFLEESNLEYLKIAVNSCMDHLISNAQGGVGLKHVTKGTLNNVVFSYPPLEEQHRIVAKVDELMVLCDQLEQQTENSITAHQTLVETLLTTLTNSANAEELQQNWARIETHFDTLFTTEHSIDQLKKTIIELASTGKLIQFPDNTVTYSVKDLLIFGPRNGLSPKEALFETEIKVLKLGATTKGYLNLDESKYVDIKIDGDSHLWIENGDILVQRGNAAQYVGCNLMVSGNPTKYIYPDLMMKLRVNGKVLPQYLSLIMSAQSSRAFMWDRMTGTSGTMPKISKRVVESIPVLVPNIETQNQVLSVVSQIIHLMDLLSDGIKNGKIIQINLANAIVEQAVS